MPKVLDTMERDQSGSNLGGRDSVVSTDKEGNVSVSIKPDDEGAGATSPVQKQPRGSFNNGSAAPPYDAVADKTVPEPEEEEFEHNRCTLAIEKVHSSFCNAFSRNKGIIKKIVLVVLLVAYFVYFGFAVYTSPSRATVVIVLTCLVFFYIFAKLIWKKSGKKIHACCCAPIGRFFESKFWSYFRW